MSSARLCIGVALIIGSGAGVSSAAGVADLFFGINVECTSRNYRVALAEALSAELSLLFNSIPNLTPREEDWLSAEESRIAALPERPDRFLAKWKQAESPIFVRADLRRRLTEILASLAAIEDSPDFEISSWAILASELGNPKVALWAKTIEEKTDWRIPTLPALCPTDGIHAFELESNLGQAARGIVEYILVGNVMLLEIRKDTD